MASLGDPGSSIGNTRDGISSRHGRILSLLEARGFVSIGSLAKSFAVSEQTVRRDLNELEKRGLVTRYHGGAGLPPVTGDVDYDKRKRRHATEKQRIAEMVAAQIPEGATIFIDIGTTMEAGAEALTDLPGFDDTLRRIRLVPGISVSETNLLLSTRKGGVRATRRA